MSAADYWNRRTYCLITGSSRGIGKELALNFARKFAKDSVIVLVARSHDNLEKAKGEILSQAPHVKVATFAVDLGKPKGEEFLQIVNSSLQLFNRKPCDFSHAIIIHNAANAFTGEGYVRNWENVDVMAECIKFNLFSPLVLNTQFMKVFTHEKVPKRTVVQVTSLMGVRPLRRSGLYCTGKAARDMAFKCLAWEEEDKLRVLNYAPGPVDTDLLRRSAASNKDPVARAHFQKLFNEGSTITCQQTVDRLMQILEQDIYKSGDWIDYFHKDYYENLRIKTKL